MTPEQAQRLAALHEAEVQVRWEYVYPQGISTWEQVQAASRANPAYLASITERGTA